MAERLEKHSGGLPQSAQPAMIHKTPDPRTHSMELDALRGIGVLTIVMSHVAFWWLLNARVALPVPLFRVNVVDFIMFFGYLQLMLFFLLSGYLLTWSEEGRRRRGIYSASNYAKRRVLRIVPACYAALVVDLLVWPFILEGNAGALERLGDPSFSSVVLNLTFLQGFLPSYPTVDPAWWSLTTEVVFYAILPLLVLKFPKLWQRVAIMGVLLLVSVATRLLMVGGAFGYMAVGKFFATNQAQHFPTTLLYLCLVGMLLRMLVERRTQAGHDRPGRRLFAASALTVVSAGLLLVVLLLVFPYLRINYMYALHSPAAMILEAVAILIFASILLGSPILKPILRLRPLVFFGEISYSLFLLHSTIILALGSQVGPAIAPWIAGQDPLTVWATFLTFSFVVVAVAGTLAYLSFRYIESPFMRIKPK